VLVEMPPLVRFPVEEDLPVQVFARKAGVENKGRSPGIPSKDNVIDIAVLDITGHNPGDFHDLRILFPLGEFEFVRGHEVQNVAVFFIPLLGRLSAFFVQLHSSAHHCQRLPSSLLIENASEQSLAPLSTLPRGISDQG
jgi:hypothetical protein